ncbi:hypothetical protein FXO38_17219 [Capsicum annuum]|nr:hypothetical protein FXO38_17219 [Capsicum annuum]
MSQFGARRRSWWRSCYGLLRRWHLVVVLMKLFICRLHLHMWLGLLFMLNRDFRGLLLRGLYKNGLLHHVAVKSNNFTGEIPPILGNLSKLYWLDLADNVKQDRFPFQPSEESITLDQCGTSNLNNGATIQLDRD